MYIVQGVENGYDKNKFLSIHKSFCNICLLYRNIINVNKEY